ncbi:LigA [Anaeromyxobacter sp. Fw109-5]|nr:LigA [Anaeromyxobacter sp. Fw109-5]
MERPGPPRGAARRLRTDHADDRLQLLIRQAERHVAVLDHLDGHAPALQVARLERPVAARAGLAVQRGPVDRGRVRAGLLDDGCAAGAAVRRRGEHGARLRSVRLAGAPVRVGEGGALDGGRRVRAGLREHRATAGAALGRGRQHRARLRPVGLAGAPVRVGEARAGHRGSVGARLRELGATARAALGRGRQHGARLRPVGLARVPVRVGEARARHRGLAVRARLREDGRTRAALRAGGDHRPRLRPVRLAGAPVRVGVRARRRRGHARRKVLRVEHAGGEVRERCREDQPARLAVGDRHVPFAVAGDLDDAEQRHDAGAPLARHGLRDPVVLEQRGERRDRAQLVEDVHERLHRLLGRDPG